MIDQKIKQEARTEAIQSPNRQRGLISPTLGTICRMFRAITPITTHINKRQKWKPRVLFIEVCLLFGM